MRLDYFICSPQLFPSTKDNTAGSSSSNSQQSSVTGHTKAEGITAHTENTGNSKHVRVDEIPVPGVVDYYSLHDDPLAECSDHCPIILIVKI